MVGLIASLLAIHAYTLPLYHTLSPITYGLPNAVMWFVLYSVDTYTCGPPPLASKVTEPSPLSVIVMFVPATKSRIFCTALSTPLVRSTMPIGEPLPPVDEPPTAHTAGMSQADQSHGTSSCSENVTPVSVFLYSSMNGSMTGGVTSCTSNPNSTRPFLTSEIKSCARRTQSLMTSR